MSLPGSQDLIRNQAESILLFLCLCPWRIRKLDSSEEKEWALQCPLKWKIWEVTTVSFFSQKNLHFYENIKMKQWKMCVIYGMFSIPKQLNLVWMWHHVKQVQIVSSNSNCKTEIQPWLSSARAQSNNMIISGIKKTDSVFHYSC